MFGDNFVECRCCRETVSKNSLACPYCGIKTPNKQTYIFKTFIVTLLFLVVGIFFVFDDFPWNFLGQSMPQASEKTNVSLPDYEDSDFQITVLDFVSGTWHSIPLTDSAPMVVENAPYNGYEIRVKNLSDASHMLFFEKLIVDGEDLSELVGFACYNIPATATVKCTIYAYPLPQNAKQIYFAFKLDETDKIIEFTAAV